MKILNQLSKYIRVLDLLAKEIVKMEMGQGNGYQESEQAEVYAEDWLASIMEVFQYCFLLFCVARVVRVWSKLILHLIYTSN